MNENMFPGGELWRLEFVEKRDGKEAAVKFARQTLAIYLEASCERGPYKDSIAVLREYLLAVENPT